MILRLPRNFLFPLTLFAFIGATVQYLDVVFTTATRWILLAALALYLLAKGRFMFGFQSRFGVMLLIYCAWCIATYTWSEVPQLSVEKAGAFSLLAVAFVSAGQAWVHDRGNLKALTYLAPVTTAALFAGLMGNGPGVETMQHGMALYEGLTDNPNMLGSLINMALPLLIWSAYKFRTGPQARWFWIALVVIALVLLLRTYARASILSAGMVGIGFCFSLKLSKTNFILVLIAAALLFAAAVGTAMLDTTYHEYLLKGGTEDRGVLYSRADVWQQSYENAKQGGWFGVGYGATVGDTDFEGGFSALTYGREKGNSQLGIIEETGLVGFGMYLLLLFILFSRLIAARRHERNPDIKVALGLVIGALAGMTVMSCFEAWWGAPGSAEAAYFWSLAGVGLGLAQGSTFAAKTANTGRMTQDMALYPAKFLPQRRVKG
jgi:O-antigen ligase